jgi:hypothetical protein
VSIVSDSKRFLDLHDVGAVGSDEPIELLRGLVRLFERYGLRDELIKRNAILSKENADLTAKLAEADKGLRSTKNMAVQLIEEVRALKIQLRSTTSCQTSVAGSQHLKQSPETVPDLLSDESFTPCRDERCRRRGLHAATECVSERRGRGPTKKDSHA